MFFETPVARVNAFGVRPFWQFLAHCQNPHAKFRKKKNVIRTFRPLAIQRYMDHLRSLHPTRTLLHQKKLFLAENLYRKFRVLAHISASSGWISTKPEMDPFYH